MKTKKSNWKRAVGGCLLPLVSTFMKYLKTISASLGWVFMFTMFTVVCLPMFIALFAIVGSGDLLAVLSPRFKKWWQELFSWC